MPATLRQSQPAFLTTPARSAPHRAPDASAPDDAMEVICPANATQLPVLRAIATSIALRADADLDLVADLRLAVDEACSALVRAAGPDEPLHCRFVQHPDAVEVTAAVWSPQAASAEDELGVLLLTSLTDRIATETQALDDGYELRTSLLVRLQPGTSRTREEHP
ncbi:ATP-binding protein [Cryptosporangium minutisporangium]|uniref:ATP-binding protein n=1 Tax=Cryptosporangium minutisporangium TaxID=113569 RepID=A0ABP6TCB4_9ACTN